jgi:hypothetical protein
MNKLSKKILAIGILVSLNFALTDCSSKGSGTGKQEEVKQQYKCPMKCSEQLFEKPGKCPSCGMELEKVSPS